MFPVKHLHRPVLSGRVSWDEYKVKFLVSKGHNEKEVADAIRNHEELKVDEESECWVLGSGAVGHRTGWVWPGVVGGT